MVVAIKDGAQTPYNFPTQETAQQFMQGLSSIDGVQLLKMQGSQNNPVQYHNDNQKVISGPPAKGKRVQPNLLYDYRSDWNPEVLNIPGLEWAGHGNYGGTHRYEFIGHHDALLALDCVQPHMLEFGISRKKQGEEYHSQALANDRFRLELTRDFALEQAALTPMSESRKVQDRHDPISFSLKDATQLIAKYPKSLRAGLSAGLCASNGNGWQLLQSFPWLAVRLFTFNDKPARRARNLVRHGMRTRQIAEAVNAPMCLKRFAPGSMERLLKVADLLSMHTEVVSHHCPKKATDQSSWLSNIRRARSSGSNEFALWVAVHWAALCQNEPSRQTLRSNICDLRDWVRACVAQSIGIEGVDSICQIINDRDLALAIEKKWQGYADLAEAGKPFNKEMSLQTVFKLSDQWHERQAETEAADVEFPQEWFEGGTVGDFRIAPVRTSGELSRYAYHLHNCATSYAHGVADGSCFIYVVFEGDELKAMLELSRRGGVPAN